MPFSDPTGGFKCFRRAALESIDRKPFTRTDTAFRSTHHTIWRPGMRIVEVPITLTDRFRGPPKMSSHIVRERSGWYGRLGSKTGSPLTPPARPPVSASLVSRDGARTVGRVCPAAARLQTPASAQAGRSSQASKAQRTDATLSLLPFTRHQPETLDSLR